MEQKQKTKKSWKTNAIFLIALWMVLLILSLTILSPVVTPFLKNLQTQNISSPHWGGYAVVSDNFFPQPLVVAISASWVTPTVSASEKDTFSAAWIGIGGLNEPSLIQVGSQHDCVGGKIRYSLWYEMLPDNSITITDITLSPGDQISASISLVDSATNQWLIEIKDVTTNQRFSQHFFYNSSQRTAEWVMERPTVNDQTSTLADYKNITFTDIKAKISDKTGTLSAFPNYKIHMTDTQNSDVVTISEYSKDGSSFSIAYK